MKSGLKIIIAVACLLLFMLIFPWMAIHLTEGLATTGLWIFAFFAVNPILVICLSIMASTEICKLWWIPIVIAAFFPLLFGVAIGELVWDLYVYSVIYLLLGVLVMVGAYLVKKIIENRHGKVNK